MDEILKFARESLHLEINDDAGEEEVVASLSTWSEGKLKELDEAKSHIAALKTQIADAGKIKMSRTEEVLSRDALKAKLESLVDAGNITPACRDKLVKSLDTPLMLSVADGAETAGYGPVLEALRENKAMNMGSRTGPQKMRLARDDDGEDDRVDPDLEKRAKAAYR